MISARLTPLSHSSTPDAAVEGKESVQKDVPNHACIFVHSSVAVAAPETARNVRRLQS